MKNKNQKEKPTKQVNPRRSSRSSVVQRRKSSIDSDSNSVASTSTPPRQQQQQQQQQQQIHPQHQPLQPLIQRVFDTTRIPVDGALPIRYDDNDDPIPYKTCLNGDNSVENTIPIPPSKPLNLNKVRVTAPTHEPPRTKQRMFNLPHCPVFYPTDEEWNGNPFEYLESLTDDHRAADFGLCKIVPPSTWRPEFSLDSTNFRFRSRSQKLDTVTASARVKHNYCRQLYRFHLQNGNRVTPNPLIEQRPIDLYRLKVDVAELGGYNNVDKLNEWPSLAKDHGHKKIKPHFQALREAYRKYVLPYETFIATYKAKSDRDQQGEIDMSFDDMDNIKYRLNGDSNNGGDQLMEDVKMDESAVLPKRLAMEDSPKPQSPSPTKANGTPKTRSCSTCEQSAIETDLLECSDCDKFFHTDCLIYQLRKKPALHEWFCDACLYGSGEYGFDEGEDHCLASFQARDEQFRRFWFETHPPLMKGRVAPNGIEQRLGSRIVSEDDVEKEFWRLVDCPEETVQTEYGADIHTTETGSAFPTLKTNPQSKYATSGWNLSNMPGYEGSVLSYIKSDVSGMTVPWIYVGMMFSTFCWHNEDHYTYSVNYMHWGETKTWYGVPGKDHEKFEKAMRESAPDLFKQQPDLLLQLVTLGNPGQLKEAGVPMYVCDQRPNEFVITFPRAFHCGFNHGLNFNEAVNFALPDWIPEGRACVEKYRSLKRNPIFSHDELLVTIVNKGFEDSTWIYLKDAVLDMFNDEVANRKRFAEVAGGSVQPVEKYANEDDYQCTNCRAYTYLSQLYDKSTKKIFCHQHFSNFIERSQPENRVLRTRYSDEELNGFADTVLNHQQKNQEWIRSTRTLLDGPAAHTLQDLKEHLKGAVDVPQRTPEYAQLKSLIREAESWIFHANNFYLRRKDTPFDFDDTFNGATTKMNNYQTLTRLIHSPLRQKINLDSYFPHIKELEQVEKDLDWAIETSQKYDRDTPINARNQAEFTQVLKVLENANVTGMTQCMQISDKKKTLEWLEAVKDLSTVKYTQQVDALMQQSAQLKLDAHPKMHRLEILKASGFAWRSKALKLCSHVQITPEEIQLLLSEKEIKDENLESDFKRLLLFNSDVRNALDNNTDTLSHDDSFLYNAKKELEFAKKYRFKVRGSKNFDMLMKLYESFVRRISNALRVNLVGFDELKLERQAQFVLEKLNKRVCDRVVLSPEDVERMCICRAVKTEEECKDALDCGICGVSFHKDCLPVGHLEAQSSDQFACVICKPVVKPIDQSDIANYKHLCTIRRNTIDSYYDKVRVRTTPVRCILDIYTRCENYIKILDATLQSSDVSSLRNAALTLMGLGLSFENFDPAVFIEKIHTLTNPGRKRKSGIYDDDDPWMRTQGRTRRPKFLFHQDPPTLTEADDKGVVKHCLCQKLKNKVQNQMSTMILGCDRCRNWFHVECMGGAQQLERLSGQKFNCPCCSLKFGRPFAFLPVMVQEEAPTADIGTNIYVDVQQTVKTLSHVVKFEAAPKLVDDSIIVLILHKFIPGAFEMPSQPNNRSSTPNTPNTPNTPEESVKRRKTKVEDTPTITPLAATIAFCRIMGWDPAGDNADVGTVDIEIPA
ncbi:hypothetical protein E3P99_01070 [Wallemia hederae]|uniref:[histone H3]-trimethyl-L-lysine(4) demethylase n=1 Tax=Wallemia hederae TaxID=1540922 RepID=A0A4T0FUM1_9BASI|nr:hypothetical protein E3P99_01070 [Wallemia hederae]